ncbi:amidohydrolase [Biformimicrobium ophioploci]|uniref:M20 family metallopeptidase n=1 Tax=Biformimicrobium ophioploci TaxID=3036711 RepID=A0ABQ6LZV5_9GAMM|nr:amidohydrolase [Microbulbifer sp. NKW57]GMG87615.1 M20 family metallopeptidase [Microbulbifer sp. NKW57]
MHALRKLLICGISAASCLPAFAETRPQIAELSKAVEPKVIEWRRHIHQNPELSNREFKTAEMIAGHLEKLGLEVQTGVAHTGVVGLLKGGKPGPVVALRADMDALPVKERVDLPFASRATAEYNGAMVPVSHACGHDTHVAILMGAAEVLSQMKDQLRGTVKFIFQPAEEGAPKGEEGGAELMVKQGVLQKPTVDVIFGLHISSDTPVGQVEYRSGGIMAAVDNFRIEVKGKQTHGSTPWTGVDPIVTSAQIINSLQTIVSRNMPLTQNAAVVTVGSIHGGVRSNIIPESVEMLGTIRTLDKGMRETVHERVRKIATSVAEANNATVEVNLPHTTRYPVTYNEPQLTAQMLPTLERVAGQDNVLQIDAITGAEDFSFFQEKVPGLYFFLGGLTPGKDRADAPPHHTPDFYIDESGLELGVRLMAELTLDYMEGN